MTATQKTINHVCPFLGMKNDANSHMAFASPLNYCNRCTPAARVKLIHQEGFCLDPLDYIQCEVFAEGGRPLPKSLRYTNSSGSASRKRGSPS